MAMIRIPELLICCAIAVAGCAPAAAQPTRIPAQSAAAPPSYAVTAGQVLAAPLIVAALPERERTVLLLRFFESLTQTQIAERVGISQMHVSRLLAKSLTRLRDQLE